MTALDSLTEQESEVLHALIWWDEWSDIGWVAPLKIGGRDGSYHRRVLIKLAKRGLVLWRYRGHKVGEPLRNMERGSCVYRLSDEGRALIRQIKLSSAKQEPQHAPG